MFDRVTTVKFSIVLFLKKTPKTITKKNSKLEKLFLARAMAIFRGIKTNFTTNNTRYVLVPLCVCTCGVCWRALERARPRFSMMFLHSRLDFLNCKCNMWCTCVEIGSYVSVICFQLYSLFRNVIAIVTNVDSIDCVRVFLTSSSIRCVCVTVCARVCGYFFFAIYSKLEQPMDFFPFLVFNKHLQGWS